MQKERRIDREDTASSQREVAVRRIMERAAKRNNSLLLLPNYKVCSESMVRRVSEQEVIERNIRAHG